jgi:exosortase D (VPLPA-CTERM-specific)
MMLAFKRESVKPFYFSPNFLISIGTYSVLLIALYFSSLQRLILIDWVKEDYSHCILIPLIVAYLIWEKHRHLDECLSQSSLIGFLFIIPGFCLYWLGELAGEYFTSYLSLWIIVFGLAYLHLGWEKLKIILFPVIFSLSMFPFPTFVNNMITLKLKILSSKLGVMMMQGYGMSAYREGNVIDLGFTKLQVVDACSGLRYLFPMMILSVLISYFYRAKWWKKTILIFSSLPLTVVTNAIRIALTAILSESLGSAVVDGFFHDFEGWLIFMVTFGVLIGEMRVMNILFPEGELPGKGSSVGTVVSEAVEQSSEGGMFLKPYFGISVALLTLNLILAQGVEFRPAIPMTRSFADFPMAIGGWKGTPVSMEPKFIEALEFTDYIMADYTDSKGAAIDFYVAYYENQQKGESIHSPATCLRGGGWVFKESGKAVVPLGGGRMLPVSRALIEYGPYQQISYYWFPMRGRMLTNAFEMKWFNFWDALTRQRTDGALVRVIVPVGEGQSVESAEMRLQEFLNDVIPVLDRFLPQ